MFSKKMIILTWTVVLGSVGIGSFVIGTNIQKDPPDLQHKVEISEQKENQKPIAVITNDKETIVTEADSIEWSSDKSYDPDGDNIVETEWENKKEQYSKGYATVRLRVKDSEGNWSNWAETTLIVGSAPEGWVEDDKSENTNHKPKAVISMNPEDNITEETKISWDYDESYDEDKDEIVEAEWKNKKEYYKEGNHIVEMRVKDSEGNWSEWVNKTFSVSKEEEEDKPNKRPIANIKLHNTGDFTTNTTFNWSNWSWDPNKDNIVDSEWRNKKSKYPVGTHTVKLRVKDSHGLWSYWDKVVIKVKEPNQKPNAVISYSPESELTTETSISWNSDNSNDPNEDSIQKVEWENKKSTYSEGSHTVRLRVQDEHGLWSDWIEETINVSEPAPENQKPNAVISYSPESDLTTETSISWSSSNSTDPDSDSIIDTEWENKKSTYSEGTHTVRLRVQDEHGLWSDWVEETISVSAPAPENQKPNAIISYSPNSDLTTETSISWNSGSSTDPDNDSIVNTEWENKKSMYSEGSHTIKLRIQDEHGLWSDWVQTTIQVSSVNVSGASTNPEEQTDNQDTSNSTNTEEISSDNTETVVNNDTNIEINQDSETNTEVNNDDANTSP